MVSAWKLALLACGGWLVGTTFLTGIMSLKLHWYCYASPCLCIQGCMQIVLRYSYMHVMFWSTMVCM